MKGKLTADIVGILGVDPEAVKKQLKVLGQ